MKDAKIGLIQYQLSPPKPYMDSKVVISDYTQMDRAIREEKKYIAHVLKAIKAAKCNVLLIQKSILRDAVTDFEARAEALAAAGIDAGQLPFEASYGRTTLEYYDGFVFGFSAPGRPDLPPMATGGRYDALTGAVGGSAPVPAVGGVVRPGLLADLEPGA